MSARPLAALCVLAVSCRRPSTDAPTRAPAPAPLPDVSVLRPRDPWPVRRRDAGVHRDASLALPDGSLATEPIASSPTPDARVVRVREGAVVVWSSPSPEGSDVIALRLDADGHTAGEARRLASVRGTIDALDADARDGVLWVVWAANRGTEGRWMLRHTALLTADESLSRSAGPGMLADARVWPIQRRWTAPFAHVRAGDDGTALVLASGDNVPCPLAALPPGVGHGHWVDCAGWQWMRVGLDRRAMWDYRAGMARPENAPGMLTRVPNGWIYAHGPVDAVSGPRLILDPAGHRVVPGFGGTSRVLPAFLDTLSPCTAPRIAWTGDAFVSRCEPTEASGEPSGTVWVRVVRDDGTAVTPARATVTRATGETIRCAGGRPVVELRWEGGSVRLDPTRAESSFALADWDGEGIFHGARSVVWAGRALVGVSPSGALHRWACDARGELTALE